MINNDDIENAKNNINSFFKLRDEIIKASPIFNEMISRLNWYQEAGAQIPEQAENFYSLIEEPVQSIISLSPLDLDFRFVAGATGSFYAVSGDTRNLVQQYGSKHYDLITSYDELNKTEDLIDEIAVVIQDFRKELQVHNPKGLLIEVKATYAKWKAGVIKNYEFAAAIRAFQDVFNGCLSRAWVVAFYNPIPKKYPEFNWNKISETLGKNGGGCKTTLKNRKGSDERLHLFFTEVLKQTKDVVNAEMEERFKEYIEHVYAIANLIDDTFFK